MGTAILCAIGMAGKLSRDEAIIAANAIKKAVADVEGDKFIFLHVLCKRCESV